MKKNDRVVTARPYNGAIHHGVVVGVSSGKVRVQLDDGVTIIRGLPQAFLPSNRPVPPALVPTYKKNSRVTWDDESGTPAHGTVVSVRGRNVRAIQDGGGFNVSGDFTLFQPSQKQLVSECAPSAMDAYEVRKYRVVPGHDDSTPFVAEIWRSGKKILSAHDDGYGGGVTYRGSDDDQRRFRADALDWYQINGGQSEFGHFTACDLWVEWFVCHRPYGRTAREYLTD